MGRNNIRHKTENTFKFLLFSERIANVNINIFHRIGHEYEDQYEINRTIFNQTLEKWNALNLTANYCAFRREINPNNLITLPQLVLHKDEVVKVLIKYLQLHDGLCLQPLLELVVALVNDLGKDFYPYYEEFLKVLIQLLNTKETDQLEWTFTSLAYIFKVLWRTLVKNINVVFNNLLPLLSDDRKDYMVNFAAESFAYVVRKVKDREYFLSLLLKGVKNNKDGVNGCGTLLFEAMRGMNGQFHTFAESIFPFLLKSLTTDKSTQKILFEILQQIILHIASDIKPQNSQLLWSNLISTLEEQLVVCKSKLTDDSATNIALLLQLIGAAIEHNDGKLLYDPVSVTKVVMQCLDENLTDKVLTVTANISVLLLMSPNVRLPQEQAYMLTKKVTGVNDTILLHFVNHIMPYPSFEALVLPAFLKRCSKNSLSAEFFHMLTKLVIHKAAPCQDGLNLENWSKYPLDFKSKEENRKIVTLMLEKNKMGTENVDDCLCSTICFPHLILDDCENKAKNMLKENLTFLFDQICNPELKDLALKRRSLFLLHLTLSSSLHILSKDELLLYLDQILQNILPLASNPELISSLQILNLYFNFMKDQNELINLNVLLNLNATLKCNFTSPYHEIRILTTNIYTLFEKVAELQSEDAENSWNVFSLCYQVEAVETHINTYRDQLKNLELLSFHKQGKLCQLAELKCISLRFLFSLFYKNFKLVWNPTMDIIATYAEGFEKNLFWNVLVGELRGVVSYIGEPPSFTDAQLDSECDFLGTLYGNFYGVDTKQTKFENYRQLLWKTLIHFPDIVEENNRDMAELLINFVAKDYSNTDDAYCSIKMDSGAVLTQTLQDHLKVFAKFHNPKAAHRQAELEKLYFDLLSHKNHEIQKLALDCILTYKHKYLLPYQEHLYNLISENNFKNELATFRIDTDSSIIVSEHREQLMFVVLKIVYSKMTAKTGMRTGGKASGQNRRNLVLRFLSGCNENEKLSFVKIAFRFYQGYFDVNVKTMIENITQNMDLDKFVSPKRLQSALNLLMLVVEKFGGPVGHQVLSFLLKVLFVIGAHIKGAYEHATEVYVGFLAALKNLRKLSLNILETFFGHFTTYPWSSDEIDVVFTIFVWPTLGKLETDGIYSPTVLLKVFSQWSSHPPYFTLLVKHEPNNPNKDEYALAHVMKLLVNSLAHPSVINAILDMIHNLLRLIPEEGETKTANLPVENVLPLSNIILERQKVTKNLNYGSSILLPHVKSILLIFERKFKSKAKLEISHRDLFILTRLSELVWESSTCDEVLKLFLPIVMKKCYMGEEVVTNYVTTVSNLLENIDEPQNHFKQISPLFGDISYISCRKIMCSMLDSIAKRNGNAKLLQISTMMNALNAWDKKWVEQPHFETRLDGYKQVQSLIDSGSLELTLGILVIFNCFHAIRNENDLALKENAVTCWRNTAVALLKRYESDSQAISYILNDVLFNIIKKGLKNKHDEVRYESILLLGHLAKESPNSHSILRDLHSLTNKVDVEVDFFENITHIQLHRHHRALIKFCATFRKLENAPNPKTLTQFILPMASHYLLNEKYAAKNSLIDSAIDTVSVASQLVPWMQYESILKYYLVKIRYSTVFQNQLVRLMIAVLNSFHFDLRNRQKFEGETDENGEEEEEERDVNEGEENEIDVENFDDDAENVEETPEQTTKVEKAVDKIQILTPSAATSFFTKIRSNLLPKLHGTLAEMTQHDGAHKINRKKLGFEREEEDLSRVPIYFAVVKLLQQLPKEMMEANLPRIFIKLCTYLKSQMESVRRTTREMLQKIILALGPSYLNMLLDHMVTLLSRGYEVHVLAFTVHGILLCLKEQYRPRDLDKVLLTVLQLCQADLFGAVADEKEVVQIGRKVSEAKATKSYEILKILAKFITEKCIMDLLLPMKTILTTSHSFKNVQKARDALRNIGLGLVENEFVEVESLFMISYGISSESVTQLLMTKEKEVVKVNKTLEKERPDCFIIQAAPVGRSGFRKTGVKSSESANAHVLVEFGLRLCLYLLKDDKVKDDKVKSLVDPFVEIFKNCLTSRHVKLNALTLNCLTKILKYKLPSLKKNIGDISEAMFAILHKYAAAGLSKGDNFELVLAAFKAMTVMVRDVKYHTINNEQLKVLLLYVEQDLYNNERQTTALTLLRAIITRKLSSAELNEVMEKVAHLSITSEATHIRLQCRIVFHQFMIEYAQKIDKHVPFYVEQLKYEMQSGRESAIEMIQTIISTFPYKTLTKFSSLFLTHLGMRLINEEVVVCKEMLANALMELFRKLERPHLDPLFNMMLALLKDKKSAHQQMAAQLCGLLLEVETVLFESRLNDLIPAILKQMRISEEFKTPGCILKIKKENDEEDNVQNRLKDHCTFQILQLLLKLCSKCPVFLKRDEVPKLAKHVQTFLGYPHDWVRLGALQFLGYVFNSLDVAKLSDLLLSQQSEPSGYLCCDTANEIKSLTLDMCAQLNTDTREDIAEQVIKNLVFIAKVVQNVPTKGEQKVNIFWLTKLLRRVVNEEIVEDVTNIKLRNHIFHWIGAVGQFLEVETIKSILYHLMAPLVREMTTTEESNAPLRQLSKKVCNIYKNRVGNDLYTKTLSKLEAHLNEKRGERKRVRTQLAVNDPEMHAKRKIRVHEKKREAKKRKPKDEIVKKRKIKRRKMEQDVDDGEEII